MDFLEWLFTRQPDAMIDQFLALVWLSIYDNPKTWALVIGAITVIVKRTAWGWDDRLWELVKSLFVRAKK